MIWPTRANFVYIAFFSSTAALSKRRSAKQAVPDTWMSTRTCCQARPITRAAAVRRTRKCASCCAMLRWSTV